MSQSRTDRIAVTDAAEWRWFTVRWVPSYIPGEHAGSESAQRSRPLPSAPADPAQSVSSADQHRQNKPNRILCGVMAPLQTSVWFLNQTRKHWCEVSRRSQLSWDEDLRHCERGNFASPRTRTPCGDIGRFRDQRTELLFCFCGFLTLSDRVDIGGILWCGFLKSLRFVDGINHNGRAMRPVSAAAGQ